MFKRAANVESMIILRNTNSQTQIAALTYSAFSNHLLVSEKISQNLQHMLCAIASDPIIIDGIRLSIITLSIVWEVECD